MVSQARKVPTNIKEALTIKALRLLEEKK